MTYLDCPCFCPALRCGSGKDHAKFCSLWIHILDLSEIVLHFSGLSVLYHCFILMLPSLNRNTPPPHPPKTCVFLLLFLHYLNYHTGICCFSMQARNLFITIWWYFLFSAMMSHAMPWHWCRPPDQICTIRTYSEVIVHTASESVQTVGTRGHPYRLITRLNTSYSFCTFLH